MVYKPTEETRRKGVAKRRRIIDVAHGLLSTGGFAAATVRRTADGAGTASSTAVTLPAVGTVTATRGSLVNVLAVTFTVSWSAVPVPGGVVGLAVSGYWVERLTTAGVPDAAAGGALLATSSVRAVGR